MIFKKKKKKKGRPRKHPFVKLLERKNTRARKITHTIPILSIMVAIYLHFGINVPLYNPESMFGGIAPFLTVMAAVYLILYGSLDPDDLTDNVKANKLIAPFVFVGVFAYLSIKEGIPVFSDTAPYYGSLSASGIFVFFYMYCSDYFQPDLDVYGSRPGMTHFPIGKWVLYYSLARSLKYILIPLTKFWYHLWTPYAYVFTHRGVSHYLILSTWLRVAYLLLIATIINESIFFITGNYYLVTMVSWLKMFFPWDENFLSLNWVIWCVPVYLTDIVHILVDYFDAVKRGMPFCPDRIPRGFLAKLWNSMKDIKNG
jgi:uncharacterized metal-binding protein